MDSYVVRRCHPGEVRGALEQLWQRNLQLEQSPASKFDWLYQQAPSKLDTVFMLGLEAQQASDGAPASAAAPPVEPRYVGTAGVGVREISVGTQLLRAGLLADLAVDREHRTVAPALRLVREVRTWALEELDLTYGFPNHHAQGVFRRVGHVALGAMARYARVLRHQSYLARVGEAELARLPSWARPLASNLVASEGWQRRAAASALDLMQLAREVPRWAGARGQDRIEASAQSPDGVDALWHRCRHEYSVVAVRSQRLLAWRYPQAAGRLWFAARQGAHLDAYALVDRVGEVAHLRDLFGSRAGVAALLPQLVFECYRRGAASISMRYLGDPWLVELLRASRFVKRDADRLVFSSVSPRLERAQQARLADPACWFLTDLDEDV